MASASELLTALLGSRADAIGVSLVALGACLYGHRFAARHGAGQEFPRRTYAIVGGLVVVGAVTAEWIGGAVGGDTAPLATVALARGIVLAATVLLVGVLIVSTARLALLHAALRVHAETERELHEAKSAADEASRAKSDFLAVMSHEIRTPLNAVLGFANLLKETELDEVQRNYIGTITSEGGRLSSLINDILDLTKIEEGRLDLERQPFAPTETAHEVLRLLGARAAEKGVELRFEAQILGPLLVSGDLLRFRQILLNLVDNALKFTPHGSVTLFMRWAPPAEGATQGVLSVRVQDTGIGIPAEKIKALFQMFTQVDSSTSRRYGGTGLGLAICQRLVRLMGGEIAVRSQEGVGSEFAFTLPFAPMALAEEPGPVADEPLLPLGRPPRVLIVDDMETNRFLLEVFLRRNGFLPDLAATGAEAVRLSRESRYDAILMDLQMPDIDGFTATRLIRAAELPGQRTPIIALTASIAKGTREKCLAAGMDEYMTKPLDLKKFRALLHRLIAAAPTVAMAL